jgi:hypothetical protein
MKRQATSAIYSAGALGIVILLIAVFLDFSNRPVSEPLSIATARCPVGQALDAISEMANGSLKAICIAIVSHSQMTNSSATCTVNVATKVMSGIGLRFTPNVTGIVTIVFGFQVSPTLTGVTGTSNWTPAYGTGTLPTCKQASTGTPVGNTYQVRTGAGAGASVDIATVSYRVMGLAVGTSYWFDFQVLDSTVTGTTYSKPQMTILEGA